MNRNSWGEPLTTQAGGGEAGLDSEGERQYFSGSEAEGETVEVGGGEPRRRRNTIGRLGSAIKNLGRKKVLSEEEREREEKEGGFY